MNGRSLSKAWCCVAADRGPAGAMAAIGHLGAGRTAAARHLAGREFQRQAAGPAVCLRLHRRGLPQGPAGARPRPVSGQPRELPARALHQQPRKRRGAGRLSFEDPERAGAAAEPRTPRSGKPAATATAPASALPNWGEGAEVKAGTGRSAPAALDPRWQELRARPRGPTRIPCRTPPAPPVAAPPASQSIHRPSPARPSPAATAAAPAPPPAPSQRWRPHLRRAPPPPPQPKQFDIFD